MSNPVLTPTLNKGSYQPGEAVTGSWTVVDADNSVETLRFEGTDSQGNAVVVDMDITRIDSFTMTKISWLRTGTQLTVNQAARTFSGTMPSA